MAADPDDNGPTRDDPAKRGPDRPPQIWPESQDMVSQQSAANALFKRHSEMLQKRQGDNREAEGEGRETQGESGKSGQQGTGPYPLAFVKDGELRYKRETEKPESDPKPEREEAEPKPQEPNRKLLFVKDRSQDLTRG